jgi:hypothetical protein
MTAQSGLGFSGIVAIQIPDDGAPGFVLTKLTADNYDYDWLAGGGGASTIIVEDEGVPVGVPADTLDFVGAGVTASGAGTTKTITIPGGSSTMQDTYDATGITQPKIEVTAGNGPITFRQQVLSTPDLFILEDNAGVDFFNVAETVMQVGETPQRLFTTLNIAGADPGYGGFTFYPDDFTRTNLVDQSAIIWLSTLTSSRPGGAPFGNDGAPNCINWAGEVILTDQGNLFNSQSLFVQGTTITCDGANSGPIYTLINQPLFRTSAAGGARTGSQQNAVRSQLRVGPNLAGSFILTSHETFFATMILNATVGAVSVTTANYFAAQAPTLTGGATVGTLNCLNIPNIPLTGITTLRGINSAMNAGFFIFHTGTAPSFFAAELRMGNGVPIRFGADPGNGIEISRSSAGVLRMIGDGGTFDEGLDWDFDPATANTVEVTSSTGAGLQFNLPHISFGTSAIGATDPNWFTIFTAANLRSPGVAGGYADVLWTAGGSIDINGLAMSDVSAFQINSISTILSGGSVADSSTLYVAAMQSANATLVQALRVLGRSTLRGRINQPSEQPAQIVANQNDYQLAANNGQRGVVLLDSDAARNITGIDSSFGFSQDGERITLINLGSFNITLTHQDVLSLAANRFISPSGVSYVLGPNESCEIYYLDDGTDRWLILWGSGA